MSTAAITNETQTTRRSRRGWLVPIFLVLAVIALLVDWGPLGSSYSNLGMAQAKSAQLDIGALAQAVDLFGINEGYLPTTFNQLVPKYVRAVHKDPWGGDYQLEVRGESFTIFSLGESHNANQSNAAIIARGTLAHNSQDTNQKRPSP